MVKRRSLEQSTVEMSAVQMHIFHSSLFIIVRLRLILDGIIFAIRFGSFTVNFINAISASMLFVYEKCKENFSPRGVHSKREFIQIISNK